MTRITSRRTPFILLLALALMFGLFSALAPTAFKGSAAPAEAASVQRIYNSKWSDYPLRVSRLFRGGSPSTRGTVPIGKESGFHPTRSYYLPAGCRAFIAYGKNGYVIYDKEDRTGWHNIWNMTGSWTIELQCGKGQGSW
jgi:hypothetical protein